MKLLYILLFAVFACACTTIVKLPNDISNGNDILLPFRVDTIIISDLRKDTITNELKIPLIAFRQREWITHPALAPTLQQDIIRIIKKASYADGLPATITLFIQDGYYKIAGNARQVGEYTQFDCIINFALKDSRKSWNSSAKSNNSYIGVFNATELHAKQMYHITAVNSVYTALKQVEGIFDK